MYNHIVKVILFLLLVTPIFAQYTPELDVQGTNDNTDGAEFQLATPSETNFLRFFSGRLGDPSPYIYFSNLDTFRIANGGADFSKFKSLLNFLPDGKIGINTSEPQSLLHLNGNLTTPWDVIMKHHRAGWSFDSQTFLRKGWSDNLYDYLYLSSTGNRVNDVQAAMVLSRKTGIKFGKGHDDANKLSEEHIVIDTAGVVSISDLSGPGKRPIYANSDGSLSVEQDTCYLSIPASAFHPRRDDQFTQWVSILSEAFFLSPPSGFNGFNAPVFLPHSSTVISTTYYFVDFDSDNDMVLRVSGYQISTNTASHDAMATTTGVTGVGSVTSTDMFTVDNKTKSYTVWTGSTTEGILGPDFKIKGVLITYLK